jgi:hypothetical protein
MLTSKAAGEQKRAGDDLGALEKREEISGRHHGVQERPGRARLGRHRDEVEKPVESEHEEGEPEQKASDDDADRVRLRAASAKVDSAA